MSAASRYARRLTTTALRAELFPQRYRGKLLRQLGARVGQHPDFLGGTRFTAIPNISIGSGVFINRDCWIEGEGGIVIEDNVFIGHSVKLLTVTHAIGDPERRAGGELLRLPVRIGKGSWLGAGAIILPGVTVAPGCVIAAGAVVTRSTSSNGLYAGTPARRMRDLGEEDMVQAV